MQLSFYNTINLPPEKLSQADANCKNQEHLILSHFKQVGKATPSDVWKVFNAYPITSIRRAITNLTDTGKLSRTQEMKAGMYGKPEHYWTIKK